MALPQRLPPCSLLGKFPALGGRQFDRRLVLQNPSEGRMCDRHVRAAALAGVHQLGQRAAPCDLPLLTPAS